MLQTCQNPFQICYFHLHKANPNFSEFVCFLHSLNRKFDSGWGGGSRSVKEDLNKHTIAYKVNQNTHKSVLKGTNYKIPKEFSENAS